MTTTCFHTLPPGSPKVCPLCRCVVPGAAREAARLRGRYSNSGPVAASTTIPNHGTSQLRLVRGSDVRDVEVMVRPREPGDGDGKGMLVAEVTKGCVFGDGATVAVGTVYPVSASVTPLGLRPKVMVPTGTDMSRLNSDGNYIVEVSK